MSRKKENYILENKFVNFKMSKSRWMSYKYALDFILNTYIAILETLESIREGS